MSARRVGLVLVGLIAVGGLWLFTRHKSSSYSRFNVLIAARPMVVASWDLTAHKLLLVTLPPSAVIEGVHGYGTYSLEALTRLGTIDHDPALLSTSVEEALAVPVHWALVSKSPIYATNPLAIVRQTFCLSCIVTFGAGGYQSNLTLGDYVFLVRQLVGLKEGDVSVVNIESTSVLVDTTLPDGTIVRALDPARFDRVIGAVFEDEAVRREAKRVAVYNTTGTPLLAQRVGRLLGHMGMLVVQLDSAEPQLGRCAVHGKKVDLASTTATVIREQYGCSQVEDEENSRAQLRVFMGTAYGSRFQPKKK